mgnify:CR=1 FL=1
MGYPQLKSNVQDRSAITRPQMKRVLLLVDQADLHAQLAGRLEQDYILVASDQEFFTRTPVDLLVADLSSLNHHRHQTADHGAGRAPYSGEHEPAVLMKILTAE